MTDDPLLTFSDVQRTGHDLASISGVDLQSAGAATVRAWEARSLALHHLAAGDMAEALKIMDAARPASLPNPCTESAAHRGEGDKMTSNVQPLTPRRLLRRIEVQDRVGLSKSTLYSRISVGSFPKPVTLGSSVRWWNPRSRHGFRSEFRSGIMATKLGVRLGVQALTPARPPLLRKARAGE
ncbi:MAG: helix-turn-helix transcriptional regulator [Stenotrophomonas maltophilia]